MLALAETTFQTHLQASSYPSWVQDMIGETNESAQAVAHHEAWYRFSDGTIPQAQHHALLIGFWPLIERFPQYLALNLLKCSYGNNPTLNSARGWLIKNLRVEQRHAEMYRDWAECAGISQARLFGSTQPAAVTAITDWCWHVCESGELVEAMAATNYAIEGITGDWSKMVHASEAYANLFQDHERKKAMRWIQAHAAYDDKHPVEALEIMCNLLGKNPSLARLESVKQAIQKSFDLYLLALDTGMAEGNGEEGADRKLRIIGVDSWL